MDSVEIVLVGVLCLRVSPRQQESLMILKAITKNFSKTTRANPLAHRLRYVLIVSRMLKRPFSKAATSEDARRALRHVELLSEARTKHGKRRV